MSYRANRKKDLATMLENNAAVASAGSNNLFCCITLRANPGDKKIQLLCKLAPPRFALRRIENWVVPVLCPVFESRGNPEVTRESRVTPGLRENSVLNSLTPG